MTDESLRQLWKTYQDAWADISQDERSKLLEMSLAQDVAYTNPDGEERGIEGLVGNSRLSKPSAAVATSARPS